MAPELYNSAANHKPANCKDHSTYVDLRDIDLDSLHFTSYNPGPALRSPASYSFHLSIASSTIALWDGVIFVIRQTQHRNAQLKGKPSVLIFHAHCIAVLRGEADLQLAYSWLLASEMLHFWPHASLNLVVSVCIYMFLPFDVRVRALVLSEALYISSHLSLQKVCKEWCLHTGRLNNMACFTCPGQATVTIIEQFGKVGEDPETSWYHPACRAATLHLMLTSFMQSCVEIFVGCSSAELPTPGVTSSTAASVSFRS